jgi:hypothetical protein
MQSLLQLTARLLANTLKSRFPEDVQPGVRADRPPAASGRTANSFGHIDDGSQMEGAL